MKTGRNSRVSTPVPGEHHLAELVNAVRAGNQDAVGEFRHLFYPGTRFLIQRRLGSVDVEQQVAEVLDMAVRTIQEDHSVGGATVTAFVRQSIVERFPTTQENPAPPFDFEGRVGRLGQKGIGRIISGGAGRAAEVLCAAAAARVVPEGPQTHARSVPGDSVQGTDRI